MNLGISSSGRYLTNNGAPWYMKGMAAQGFYVALNTTDATTFLTDLTGSGFNAILVESVTKLTATAPANVDGDKPWGKIGGGTYTGAAGTADFANPNNTYWQKLAARIDLAASFGVVVVLYVMSYGFDGNEFYDDLDANHVGSTCFNYGTFLAVGNGGSFGGLAGKTNVILVAGSDDGVNRSSFNDAISDTPMMNIIAGMRASGCNQILTGDWRSPSLSTDEPIPEPNMQLNGAYTYGLTFPSTNVDVPPDGAGFGHTYLVSRAGWNYVPSFTSQSLSGLTTPTALVEFLKETRYENFGTVDGVADRVRTFEFWAMLSGCTAGLLYGNENIWPFAGGGVWQSAMTDPGVSDMTRWFALVDTIPWWKLVPSELTMAGLAGGTMRRLVTSSNGTQSPESDTYVAASQAYDGSLMLVYFPATLGGSSATQTADVDMRSMQASSRWRWWNLKTGAFSTGGGATGTFTTPNTGTVTFTTPGSNGSGNNDWLLLGDTPAPPANPTLFWCG